MECTAITQRPGERHYAFRLRSRRDPERVIPGSTWAMNNREAESEARIQGRVVWGDDDPLVEDLVASGPPSPGPCRKQAVYHYWSYGPWDTCEEHTPADRRTPENRILPSRNRDLGHRKGLCECEDSHCAHGAESCNEPADWRVSPSYVMCRACAHQWLERNPYVKKAKARTAAGPRLSR